MLLDENLNANEIEIKITYANKSLNENDIENEIMENNEVNENNEIDESSSIEVDITSSDSENYSNNSEVDEGPRESKKTL